MSSIPIGIDPAAYPRFGASGLQTAVLDAFDVWEDVACADIGFSFQGATAIPVASDGENTIGFISEGWSAYDSSPATIAITDLVYAQRADGGLDIIEADILFNDQYFDFTVGTASATALDVRTVLAHELGHLLGLAHCCEHGQGAALECSNVATCTTALMNPGYDSDARLTPSADDVQGICAIYGDSGCLACAEGEVCVGGACAALCGADVCDGAETCVDGACRLPCTGCGAADECVEDGDCADGRYCDASRCVFSAPLVGDPCARDIECATGLCTSEGYCSRTCPALCPEGFTCGGPSCAPTGGLFGDDCTMGEQCVSRVCLLGETDECTRGCSVVTPCPEGFDCAVVDSESSPICVPRQGGCSVNQGAHGRTSEILLLSLLMALLVSRRPRSHKAIAQ